MKELDETTLKLVKHLTEKQRTMPKYRRGLRFIVVWVDGDKEKLTKWSAENGLTEVPICVVCSNEVTLIDWQLNPMAMRTIVFMDRTMVVGKLIDLETDEFKRIDDEITKHFARYRL